MKIHFNIIQSLVLITFAFVSGILYAAPEAKVFFRAGLDHYQQKKYTLAIPALENAVRLQPKNAEYHHILAVSYGREAERVNWFSAMSLAKKALVHLEIAASLDPGNLEILDDLMDFYREAPIFLGGNIKKADEIKNIIKKLSTTVSKNSVAPVK